MASQFDSTHISHISGHVDHTFPVNLQLQGASRHLHKHLRIRKPQTVGRGRSRTAAAAGSQCVARSYTSVWIWVRSSTFIIWVLIFSGNCLALSEYLPILHTKSFEISSIRITQWGLPMDRQVTG